MVLATALIVLVAAGCGQSSTPAASPSSAVEPHVWALGVHSVLLSADGGTAWRDVAFSENLEISRAIAAADANHAWLVTLGGVRGSADGGASWSTMLDTRRPRAGEPGHRSLLDVAVADRQHVWLVGMQNPSGVASEGDRFLILATSDGGRSWQEQLIAGRGSLTRCSFVDADHGWVIGGWSGDIFSKAQSYVYATSDGGSTWARQLSSDYHLDAVVFADRSHGWMVAGSRWDMRTQASAILATDDGGVTWTAQLEGDLPLREIACVDAEHAWVVGSKGVVLATKDGGATWLRQDPGTDQSFYDVAFADERRGWAVAASEPDERIWPLRLWSFLARDVRRMLFVTSDGGASWAPVEYDNDSYRGAPLFRISVSGSE